MSTTLNHYRLLGRSGLRVSPLCLGTMTFGEDWGWGGGKDESRRMLDAYAERGGTFIDTANLYTNGTSEKFVGEFLQGRRDQFVLATKYTFTIRPNDPNAAGNHRKNLRQSLEASLKRLNTDYIDLYWVHAWDSVTHADELMRALDDLVRAGKILYPGVSDFPAWKVAQANTLADARTLSPFVALQIEYSLVERTVEHELVPMARELELGITPWSPLGGGVLTGKYNSFAGKPKPKDIRMNGDDEFAKKFLTQHNFDIAAEVVKIAQEINRSPAQVALAWLLHQPGVVSPIIGGRSEKQIVDNLAAVEITLSGDQLARLDRASAPPPVFIQQFLKFQQVRNILTSGTSQEQRR